MTGREPPPSPPPGTTPPGTTPGAGERAKVGTGSVLFVCNHNTIRSPMAEALARLAHGRRLFTASAGLQEGWIDPFVVAVLAEAGIDAGDHQPRLLADVEDEWFDAVITLTPSAHHRALEMTRTQPVSVEYWPVPDPTAVQGSREQRMAAYRETRDYIARRVAERFGGA